ncbi:hypothetical protein J3E68DRAFT_847 [Trichoderma sp. SZMC 28012]
MGMHKVWIGWIRSRDAKLRQRVRKQSLELFVRVEILFWLRGLCLCDSEDAAQSGPGAGYHAVPGCWHMQLRYLRLQLQHKAPLTRRG